MKTIYERFIETAEAQQAKAVFERPGKPTISFAELRAAVGRLATVLADLGVERGARVAAQVEKSPEAIALYLATLQVGGIFLPLNTAYTSVELDYFLEDAAPRLFVCDPSRLDTHASRGTRRLRVETLGAEGEGSLMTLAAGADQMEHHVPSGPSDRAAILYTSGTTGRSKGAVLTHGNLASNVEALLETWHFDADERLIHALPIFHAHGLFVAANMALAAGATMIFLARFDPEQVIDLMPEATVMMGVPTFYTRLLKSDRLTREAASGMRLFVSGSAPLLAEDHRAFSERTGHAILERYGMTETCMIASNPYEGERIPGAVGMALPGVSIRVTDRETGRALPVGEIGLVEVKGPNVFESYWNMPEKTAAEFRPDGYFMTGDLGTIGEDGYLRLVGREKDLVISGGYNIYPKEIEELLDSQAGILESAVIGVPHPDFGEALVAVVVARPGEEPDLGVIREDLSTRLARFKLPKRIVVVDALPRNVMGKVQKAELRKAYSHLMKEIA